MGFILQIIENVKIPTVAAIKGAALGGGFELALGCDFIIAADTARIGLVETSVGLIPLSGGVQRLINRVGSARTKEIADEIVRTQDSLVGGRYGCRMATIRKYSHIYSWLSKDQIDWHVREIKKRRSKANSSTTIHNSNVATKSTNISDINTNLFFNDFTVDEEISTW